MRVTGASGRLAAGGRSVVGVALVLLAISLAWAASAFGAGAAFHRVHSRPHLRAFWTPERIRHARPLSALTYTRPGGRVLGRGGATASAAFPTAQGTDTGDSTIYPN